MKWLLPLLILAPVLFTSTAGAKNHVDSTLCNELEQIFKEAVEDGVISLAESTKFTQNCYDHSHK